MPGPRYRPKPFGAPKPKPRRTRPTPRAIDPVAEAIDTVGRTVDRATGQRTPPRPGARAEVKRQRKRAARKKVKGLDLGSKGRYRPPLMSRKEKRRKAAVKRALGTYELLQAIEDRRRNYAKNPQYADDQIKPYKDNDLKIAGGLNLSDAGSELKRSLAPAGRGAMNVLAETSRPVHGIAGGTLAGIQGKNVLSATKRGLQLKDRKLFSDVLEELGAPKGVQAVGGFALDVGLDPTTYLTFGSTIPLKGAARAVGAKTAKTFARYELAKAAAPAALKTGKKQKTVQGLVKEETSRATRKVEERARRRGRTVSDAQRAQVERRVKERFGTATGRPVVRRAERRALNAGPGNRGLTVGTRKRATSGRSTAAVSRRVGIPNIARTAKEHPATQAVGETFRPDFVKAGVSRTAFKNVRHAEAEARAALDTAEHMIGRRARAYHKKFGPADYRKIVDAIETGKVGKLRGEPALHQAAVRLRSDLRHMARLEKQAGLRATTRKNYIPHLRRQDIEGLPETLHGTIRKKGSGAKLGSAKARKLEGTLKDWRGKDPSLFTDDVAQIYGQRAGSSARALSTAKLVRSVADEGRKLTPKSQWDTATEAVYKVEPTGLRKLEKDGKVLARDIEKASEGKAAGQYVILNKRLADELVARNSPADVSVLRAFYRRQHGRYKTALTQPMPSYHLRNLYGDTSNASYKQNVVELGANIGRGGRALKAQRQLRKAQGDLTIRPKDVKSKTTKIDGKPVKYTDLVREAEQHGGINQGFSRELTEMMEKGEGRFRNFGQSRENLVRFASYIGARKQGLSAKRAADRVRELHFDYADLTNAERSIRDFLPFYTFAARNTPLQVKTLVTRPGKLARYDKLMEEGAAAAGLPENWQDNLKEYQRLGLAMPLFGAEAAGQKLLGLPGLPLTDLNRLTANPQEQLRLIAGMVSGFKAVGELLVDDEGYSLFFRGPIDRGSKVAAPDWLHSVLPKDLQKVFGLEFVYDRGAGKKIWKYNAKADYALKQLPETSFLFGITSTGKNQRSQDKTLKALKLTGVSVEPYDPDRVRIDQLYKRLDQITKRTKQLNDQNIYADSANKEYRQVAAEKKKVQAQLDKIMLRQKKRGEPVKLPKRLTEKKSSGSLLDSSAGPSSLLDTQKRSTSLLD